MVLPTTKIVFMNTTANSKLELLTALIPGNPLKVSQYHIHQSKHFLSPLLLYYTEDKKDSMIG